jgi:regulator of RNase E activity RraA
MVETKDIKRPPAAQAAALAAIGTATTTSTLHRLGVRNAHICGPVAVTKGLAIAGPALTLQFMPKREDLYGEDEYADPEKQLHRHVLYHTQPGDIVVVDARADMKSGIFGEMMLTYFKGKGGAGVVIDGCIRDYPNAKDIGVGLWLRGLTPNFHTQTDLMPFAVNVPIACGGVLVMPGDIIVADDDGAVVVPVALATRVIEQASQHHEWEDFSRERLAQGGDLRRYYPLSDAARPEYEEWKRKRKT